MFRFRNPLSAVRLPRDPLFRLLVINGLAGTAVAVLVLAGIFITNIGRLRDLVLTAQDPVLPVLMLGFSLVITLASVVMGSAIMLLRDPQSGGGTFRPVGRQGRQAMALQPVRVTASTSRRDHRL